MHKKTQHTITSSYETEKLKLMNQLIL